MTAPSVLPGARSVASAPVWPGTVVHTIPAVAEEASGPSYSVMRLCESLAERRPTVLAAIDEGPVAGPAPFLRQFAAGWQPARLGRSPAMKRWLDAEARAGRVGLLHTHSLWMLPNIYPGQIGRRRGVPLVVSPRGTLAPHAFRSGTPLKRLLWPLLQRPTIAHAACFHATSLQERDDIRAYGFHQPIAVVPNGVDLPTEARTAKPLETRSEGRARTLLYLGRLHPIKGLDRLLAAWQHLAPRWPDWTLRLVGPDNDGHRAELERLALRLGLPRVEFAGPAYGDQKWREYAAADLYALPTHTENFGMSVAEALASGTPVVVTEGAPWQGLRDHRAGWWIEHGVNPLVAALDDALARSPADLRAMGERGRTWMQQDFSWQGVAARMSAVYDWLLEGGAPPPWVYLE